MLKYKDVSPDRQTQLDESKDIIRHRLERSEKVPRNLLDRLDRYLDDNMRGKVVEVRIIDPHTETPHWGEARGFCVHLQPRTFDPWEKTEKPRLTAVLFHELVHVAGGTELDAEVFENLLFQEDEGAWPPTLEDLREFERRKGKGAWLSLRLDTGIVTGQPQRELCRIERIEHGDTGKDSRVIPLG
jgi:hypothetical protein